MHTHARRPAAHLPQAQPCLRAPHTPLKELFKLSLHLRRVEMRRGDELAKQNCENSSIYFLLEGETEVVVDVPKVWNVPKVWKVQRCWNVEEVESFRVGGGEKGRTSFPQTWAEGGRGLEGTVPSSRKEAEESTAFVAPGLAWLGLALWHPAWRSATRLLWQEHRRQDRTGQQPEGVGGAKRGAGPTAARTNSCRDDASAGRGASPQLHLRPQS
eukprot:312268-Chlamydomonas_euryale.AAC.2